MFAQNFPWIDFVIRFQFTLDLHDTVYQKNINSFETDCQQNSKNYTFCNLFFIIIPDFEKPFKIATQDEKIPS